MTIYSKGLLIGRFQPFHKGHLYLLHHVKGKAKKLVVGIGSANVFDEDNPFTYEERKAMIEKVLQEEDLNSFVDKIVPLNDYYDDEYWFRNTLQKSGAVDVVVGNNEWSNRIFETGGYKIWRVGFFKRYLYEGEKIRTLIHKKKNWSNRVPQYLAPMIEELLHKRKKIPYRFQRIGIGGTFDHFHRGHKKLIDTALRYGHFISIGVTTKPLHTKKNFSTTIESCEERKISVSDYLKKKQALKRATFFPLTDIYGTTKTDGTIEAIVVSKETYPNAIKINKFRHKKSLPELKIIKIDDVKAEDGKLISSERIRSGEIDREGINFQFSIFSFQKNTLLLPEEMREKLRKPLGKVIRGKENQLGKTVHKVMKFIKFIKPKMVIAVGDIIYTSLIQVGLVPDIGVIDYKSRRVRIGAISNIKYQISKLQIKNQKEIINKQGTISKDAVEPIKKAIDIQISHPEGVKPQLIIIEGEEDLLALPAILFAPLRSVVLYGQMDLGVVMVEVDEKIKNKVRNIVKEFRQEP